MESTSIQIDRDKFGTAGIHNYAISVYQFQENNIPDEVRLNDNTEREFEVVCSLAKQQFFSDEIQASLTEQDGESYFQLPDNVSKGKAQTPTGNYIFHKNSKGELARISLRCTSNTWSEAFNKFHSGITPLLDHLTYKANCPLIIDKVSCVDLKNQLSVIDFLTPYPSLTINPHSVSFPNQLIPIYALYREAKNNASNYYRFLCYYKIMEGIFKQLRPQLFQMAKSQNITITKRKETLPPHKEIEGEYKNYIGRPIQSLFEQELKSQYRNTVAHFLLDDGTVLNISDYHANLRFAKIILLSEICCREVIMTQESYYEQFEQNGGVNTFGTQKEHKSKNRA